jgi:Rieske Fe-S protein
MLMVLALGRRAWAQVASFRYSPLARPVLVPLADMAAQWRARRFVAEGVTLESAARPNQPIRVAGMVVRIAAGDDKPERFQAMCLRCPHEGCDVDYVSDPGRLPPEIQAALGRVPDHPMYVCPCHNSAFRPDDGERVSGPAPRGLYRFRVTSVTDAAIEIGEVEEDVLIFA